MTPTATTPPEDLADMVVLGATLLPLVGTMLLVAAAGPRIFGSFRTPRLALAALGLACWLLTAYDVGLELELPASWRASHYVGWQLNWIFCLLVIGSWAVLVHIIVARRLKMSVRQAWRYAGTLESGLEEERHHGLGE